MRSNGRPSRVLTTRGVDRPGSLLDPDALDEELASARETLSSATGDLQEARVAHGSARSRVADREKALSEIEVPEADVASLERELEVIDAELSGLGEAGEIQKLQLAMDEAKEQLDAMKEFESIHDWCLKTLKEHQDSMSVDMSGLCNPNKK